MDEHEIGAIAERQHGVVSHHQLLAAGLTRRAIDHRLASGRLVRLHEGVYTLMGVSASRQRDLVAATLAVGAEAGDGVVSHRTAAQLWDCYGGTCPIEVSVTRDHAPRPKGVQVHRSRDLHPDHTVTRAGILVTTPARTLLDLGQVTSWWTVSSVLDRMLRRELVSIPAVRATIVLHSRRGRRGIGALRRAVDHLVPGCDIRESDLEDLMVRRLVSAGLPTPVSQFVVEVAGGHRRLDFAYPELRLAIEVDGFEFHSGKQAFESDRVRDNELTLLGWTVLRFTWNQVVHRPEYVVATIQAARRRAILGK